MLLTLPQPLAATACRTAAARRCRASTSSASLPRRGPLPCMAARQQQPLSNAEKKARRSESQRLGKQLVTVNIGKAGLTERFLLGLLDAQAGNEYVKVRVGGSCDLDPAELAEAMAEVTDAVVVHQIGFTFTLYRDKSLPRRSRKEAMAALAAVLEEEEEGESEGEEEGGSDEEQEEEGSGGEEVGEQQQRQRQQGAAGGARSAGGGSSSGAAQGAAGGAAAAAAEGNEEGEWEGGEGSDSDDEEAAALAEEVDVVIGGVKRRIQKPPEFIVIKD